MIPVSHAYRLYDVARDPKELWLAPGANHCGAYFLDRPAYCQRVATFFERALAAQETPAAQPATVRSRVID